MWWICVWTQRQLQVSLAGQDDDVQSRLQLVDGLKTSLRTQPMSFVLRFIELGGLDCLLDFLQHMTCEQASGPVHASVLGCLKALMNSTVSVDVLSSVHSSFQRSLTLSHFGYHVFVDGCGAFGGLTLLVGRQEEHPACKIERCCVGVVICLE